MADVRSYPVFSVLMTVVVSADQHDDAFASLDMRAVRGRLLDAVSAMSPPLLNDSRIAVSGLRVVFEHLAAVRPVRGEDR